MTNKEEQEKQNLAMLIRWLVVKPLGVDLIEDSNGDYQLKLSDSFAEEIYARKEDSDD